MKRVNITLKFSADLDQVPGWGYDPDDWVKLVNQALSERVPHYNPRVLVRNVYTSKKRIQHV